MKHVLIPILVGASILIGCTTSRHSNESSLMFNREWEDQFYWGNHTYLLSNSEYLGPPKHLTKDANDKSLHPNKRRFAAAVLFAGRVKPGFTTE